MDPERWRRIKGLFNEALERPVAEREAFLGEAAGEDPALLEHLRRLLAAHEETSDRLEGGALEAALPALHDELQAPVEGLRIGPYRVISELGRGGMGAVYLAARADGAFEQEVAVKLIKRGMDSDEIVRRFVHERQILASLVHPNIARLLDGGTTAEGRPYFVMEPVLGQPITVYAEASGLGLEARLRLFLPVAAAVQFAHQSLVVHRDLKPANVLVGADGIPKLLDFGIAKLLAPDGGKQWTALDHQPLTPDYASPEQLDGRPVTTATDVHGLGLLLYELLVGDIPVAVERQLGPGWRERPASQAARALGKASGSAELRRRARRLEGDLDTILNKALAADPAKRYGTAAEFAEDLERHLSHRPVRARRPTLAYRLGRAVMGHRLASAFVLSLVATGAAMTWQATEQRRLRQQADHARHQAETRQAFLFGLFRAADPEANRGAEIKAREVLAVGAKLLLREKTDQPTWLFRELGDLPADPQTRAQLLLTIGEVQMSLGLSDAERPLRAALELAQRSRWEGWRLDAARAWTSLGFLYRERSEYARGRRAFEQALPERRRLLGPRAVGVADVLNGLGLIAVDTDDRERARKLFGEARAIYEERREEGRLGVARTLNNLGLLAAGEGNQEEAARYYRQALAVYRERLGDDHPDSVRMLSNLAFLEYQRGDYPAAEERFREILRLRRQLLGPAHPDLVLTLRNLAVLEERRGSLADAESTVRQALAMRARLGLPDDGDQANTLNTLATILRERGDRQAARAAYQQSLRLYRRLFGEQASVVARAIDGLAWLDLESGEQASAETGARQTLAIRDKADGPEHSKVADSLFLLAKVLQAAGRSGEAEAAFRRCLELRRRKLPPRHPLTAESLVGLGSFLVEHGRAAEAEPVLREGLALLRPVLPAEHVAIGIAAGRLSACYTILGRPREARALLEESRRALAATAGERRPDTLEVRELRRQLDTSRASSR